jgi:hypothetical protein
MNNNLSVVALFLIAALQLSSCMPYRFSYNQSPDFSETVGKVYITAESWEIMAPFAHHFASSISQGMRERGVENQFYFKGPLSLKTEQQVEEEVRAYGTKWHLDIRQAEQYSIPSGEAAVPFSGFDLRLFDLESDQIVWRGSLFGVLVSNHRWLRGAQFDRELSYELRALTPFQAKRAERMSAELVEALSHSRIIP